MRGGEPFPYSFDGWLLEQAKERGAEILCARVMAIYPGKRPSILTAQERLEADLVVVATGVNSRAPLDPSWGYQHPKTETMAQDEVPFPLGLLGRNVHIFLDYPPGLFFGALIPKGRYVNISLLGRDLALDAVKDFIEGHVRFHLFPEGVPLLCGCTPRVAISPARHYYADRMVAVGDAAVTRLYKDGIGSAFITSEAAARTAIEQGITKADFHRGYAPTCRKIAQDNLFGQLLFSIWMTPGPKASLLKSWLKPFIEGEQSHVEQLCRRALWALFTGDESYRQVFVMVLRYWVSTWLLKFIRPTR